MYATKTCVICGKEFVPVGPRQRYCCVCGHNRQSERATAYRRQRDSRTQELIASLEAEIERLKAENTQLRQKLEPTLMYVCERMKLRTMQPLPCGRRQQCWSPEPCKKVPPELTRQDAKDPAHEINIGSALLFQPKRPPMPADAYLPSTDRGEQP